MIIKFKLGSQFLQAGQRITLADNDTVEINSSQVYDQMTERSQQIIHSILKPQNTNIADNDPAPLAQLRVRRYRLGPGKHRFRVRSKTRDGRSDPRNHRFRVKRR